MSPIESLKLLERQARHNANRQRRKEKYTRITVRVSSTFWEQVAADYRKEIKRLNDKESNRI